MVRAGEGTILVTGATAGTRGGNGFSGFAMGKFGLRALTQSLAREFQPQVLMREVKGLFYELR